MNDFIIRDRSCGVKGTVFYAVRLVRNRRCVASYLFYSILDQMRCSAKLHAQTGLHVFSVVTPSIVYPVDGQAFLFSA